MIITEVLLRPQGEQTATNYRRGVQVSYQIAISDALRTLALSRQHRVGLVHALRKEIARSRPHASRDEITAILDGWVQRIRRAHFYTI